MCLRPVHYHNSTASEKGGCYSPANMKCFTRAGPEMLASCQDARPKLRERLDRSCPDVPPPPSASKPDMVSDAQTRLNPGLSGVSPVNSTRISTRRHQCNVGAPPPQDPAAGVFLAKCRRADDRQRLADKNKTVIVPSGWSEGKASHLLLLSILLLVLDLVA